MNADELLEIINRDEDGKHQFKSNVTNQQSLAEEMIAFSNSGGGQLFIGINDDGSISGLTKQDMWRLNQLVSNTANDSVKPSIVPHSENISTPGGMVMLVDVLDGLSKPYMDNKGAIWVKKAGNKKQATSREEIQRLFQTVGLIHGDELSIPNSSIDDVDKDYFKRFFRKFFGETVEEQDVSLPRILQNMNLLKDDKINVTGLLIFGTYPEFRLPIFIVKAAAFPGNDFHENKYIDSREITGKLETIFQNSMSFIMGNLHHLQGNKSVNSYGEPEIPAIVFEELIANALIHRDYLVSAPIRILIFDDRVDIISPGHLPNNLTIENIKSGNSNIRNPILASFATKILPYKGLGSGINRALKAYPDIEFEDDREGNLFKVTIRRIGDE